MSDSETPAIEPISIGAPFDDEDADLIVRSSDLVEFRVYGNILKKASSPIKTMLSLSAPSPTGLTSRAAPMLDKKEGLIVVCLPEKRDVLLIILSTLFAIPVSIPDTLEDLIPILAIAQKYEMHSVLTFLRRMARFDGTGQMAMQNSFRAYCLAWQHGLKVEAIAAARATLENPMTIEGLGADLYLATGPCLYELLKCRTKVKEAFQRGIREFRQSSKQLPSTCKTLTPAGIPRWFDEFLESSKDTLDMSPFLAAFQKHARNEKNNCVFCADLPARRVQNLWIALESKLTEHLHELEDDIVCAENDNQKPPQSAKADAFGPPFDREDADVILRSSDLVDFRFYKTILSFSSPFFRDMFTLPQSPPSSMPATAADNSVYTMSDGLPVIDMSEDRQTLSVLLSLISPVLVSMPPSFEDITKVLAASQKYCMDSASALMRSLLSSQDLSFNIDARSAFRVYAIASTHGLAKEALQAARYTLEGPMTFEHYGEDIRLVAGGALYALSRYRSRCRMAAHGCIKQATLGETVSSETWGSIKPQSRFSCRSGHHNSKLPPWLFTYVEELATKVQSSTLHPSAKLISDTASFRSALVSHAGPLDNTPQCIFCVSVYAGGGDQFCSKLEEEINRAISKIYLTIRI
ncbi:hypothetical protein BV25DRAFT_1826182 [Artomyces pyxidatus]|uniref:Uncharacterized protein n=1 Tax=Artomyces pyxidatus TaxID=48021 RepID=A0ACB8T0A9_9AGAM|nr:hypothetical protein BV25DRAFT_1826182 [Artomyces pyxidatus]